jgi:hypothetical protein
VNEDEPIEVEVVEIDGAPPPPPPPAPDPTPSKPLWQQSLERLLSGETRSLGCLGSIGLVLLLVFGALAALSLLLIRGVFRVIGNSLRSLLGH